MKNFAYFLCIFICVTQYSIAQYDEVFEISKSHGVNQVIYADINNDGHIDVIAHGTDLAYYLGEGNNNYGMKKVLMDSLYVNVATICRDLEVVDLDQNGYLDIVIGQSELNRLMIFWNDNLNFERDSLTNIVGSMTNFAIVDIDQDNDNDIVLSHKIPASFGSFSYKITVYNNDGFGNFGSVIVHNNKNFRELIKKVDLNSDGTDEIISLYNNSGIYKSFQFVRFNSGSINYGLLSPPSSRIFQDFTTIDVDEDGWKDIVVAHTNDATKIHWYKNNNNQSFTIQEDTVPSHPAAQKLSSADIDMDGKDDLIFFTGSQIVWYKVDVTGDFVYQGILIQSISSVSDIQYIDVNEDLYKDFVIIGGGRILHFLSNGQGSFNLPIEITHTPGGARTPLVFDVDNDGLADVVYTAAGNDIVWQKNLGNGVYSTEKIIERNYFTLLSDIVHGDIDNDGDEDLIFSCNCTINSIQYTNKLIAYYNNGIGEFTSALPIDNFNANDLQLVDLNNDNFLDIIGVATSSTGSNYRLTYFLNNGSGTAFSIHNINSESIEKKIVEVADFNADGTIDILTKRNNKLKLYSNIGGVYNSGTDINRRTIDFEIGDFDNDNDVDIMKYEWTVNQLTPDYTSTIILLLNDGIGSFNDSIIVDIVPNETTQYLKNIRVIDYDLDGDLDLFSVEYFHIYYHENLGNGVFAPKTAIISSLYSWLDMTFGDTNNDGDWEIVYTNAQQHQVKNFASITTGNMPVLQVSSSAICPGEQFQISVQNPNELNDNTTWGLFNSCGGALLDTSSVGVFDVTILSEQVFYVRAIGGVNYSGECESIDIQFTSVIEGPNLNGNALTFDSIQYNWESNSGLVTGWEYSLNDGLSWQVVPLTTDSIIVGGLNANQCYNFMIRALGGSSSCSNNESTSTTICTPCQTLEFHEFINVCYNDDYTLPDGQLQVGITDTLIYESNLFATNGCDSVVYSQINPIPMDVYSVFDTICKGTDYTFQDGSEVTDIQSEEIKTVFINPSAGCIYRLDYNIQVREAYDTLITEFICEHDDYFFEDGTSVLNVVNNVSYNFIDVRNDTCNLHYYYQINVLPVHEVEVDDSVCQGQNYLFGSQLINSPGQYFNTFTNNFGCDSIVTLNLSEYNCSTSSIEEVLIADILVYPNPSNGIVYIVIPENEVLEKVELWNSQGKRIESFYNKELNLNKYDSGLYYLLIKSTDYTLVRKLELIMR